MSLTPEQCAESSLGGGVCIKRSPDQSHSGELASGTPLGTAEKLVTSHLFPKKLSDYYQDAGLLFLHRSYCGGGSGLLNTRDALLKETQLPGCLYQVWRSSGNKP